MTDSPTLELLHLDPATLVLPLDGNVRKDTQLDKHFLASVKHRGVLTPVLVTRNGDGGFDVLDGQRRTLAAVEAGATTIPAVVTSQRENQDRIADQLVVNDQRTNLTDVEHATALKQLTLFGMSAMQISRQTSTPLARVGDAIKVASTPAAAAALEHGMTLTQAVVVAEFSDNTAAVKKLTDIAERNPDGFDHVVKNLRDKRDRDELIEQLRAEITADGFTALEDLSTYSDPPAELGLTNITRLARPETPRDPITVDDIRGVAGAAAALRTRYLVIDGVYKDSAEIAYYIPNPEQHGFIPRSLEREKTEEEREGEVQREIERQTRAEQLARRDQASTVRTAFLAEFLQRPTLPADTVTYIAWASTWAELGDPDDRVLELLDLAVPDNRKEDYRALDPRDVTLQQELTRRPKRALHILFAHAVVALERNVGRYDPDWTHNHEWDAPLVRFHLEQLRAWGYGLSDYETETLAALPDDTIAPATEEPESQGSGS